MSWQDRLKQAAYTSPEGQRFVFLYENVSRESDKKTTVFTFPDFEGAFVQDLGRGGRRYPLRIIFAGNDYDTEADNFFLALEQKGIGKLEHPRYGIKNVVPSGTIKQRDDLKTAANQAVFEVEFWETILEISFPLSDTDATTLIGNSIDDFQENTSEQFANELNILTSAESVDFKSKFTAGITAIKTVLKDIVEVQQEIKSQFNTLADSIINNIDDLIGTPALLGFETIQLLRLPSRVAALIEAKIEAYGNLFESFISDNYAPAFNNVPENRFLAASLFSSSCITAIAEATLETEFETKPNALNVSDYLYNIYLEYEQWNDINRRSINLLDMGESYQNLTSIIIFDASRLVEISFSLKQERIIILDKRHTIIDLTAELYGSISDEDIDFFISSNNLTGDEIIELPIGREIKYYV